MGRSEKVKKTTIYSLEVNNTIIINKRDFGNALNKYFTSIAHELDTKLRQLDSNSSEADLPCYSSSIFLSSVTTYECCDIIAKLKSSSRNLFRSVWDIICQSLTELIICSFEKKNFPKVSEVSLRSTLIKQRE